jgi:hypothetical protein
MWVFRPKTSRQHLIDHYSRTVGRTLLAGTIVGDGNGNTLNVGEPAGVIVHGLGGDDTITGSGFDDTIVGAGTFVYKFTDDGDDIITDFDIGTDTLDITQLLGLRNGGSNSDYVTVENVGADAKLSIDHDGTGGVGGVDVTITLEDLATHIDPDFIDSLFVA